MTQKTQYRVYLVSYPFDAVETTQVRPMVALTDPAGKENMLMLAPIQSNINTDVLATDILLTEHLDFLGLKEKSILHLGILITLPVEKLRRELGYVPKYLRQEIHKKLADVFGLEIT